MQSLGQSNQFHRLPKILYSALQPEWKKSIYVEVYDSYVHCIGDLLAVHANLRFYSFDCRLEDAHSMESVWYENLSKRYYWDNLRDLVAKQSFEFEEQLQ